MTRAAERHVHRKEAEALNLALAQAVGADPATIVTINAIHEGDQVTVTWSGHATLTLQEFSAVLDQAIGRQRR